MLNTELKNRTLWFDGDSSYDPSMLSKFARMYDITHVDFVDEGVRQYNQLVSKEQELTVKAACRPLDHNWNIPEEYQKLGVVNYIAEKHLLITAGLSDDECNARDTRLASELRLFRKHDLFGVLRTIIFIINKLTTEDIVWGVGRGSSVSSYVLYVIGVHDVDSYMYDLDMNDFISE